MQDPTKKSLPIVYCWTDIKTMSPSPVHYTEELSKIQDREYAI